MTFHADKGPKPQGGDCLDFDHMRFWVGNAYQCAAFHCLRFGFKQYAYKGLETGSRDIVSYVVKKGKALLVFDSPLRPGNEEMGAHMTQHGDGIKDSALTVDNCEAVFQRAVDRGAKVVKDMWTEEDEFGSVTMAQLKTFGDAIHTLVERKNYKGLFLPGYKPPLFDDCLAETLPDVHFVDIDHFVANQDEDQLRPIYDWYINCLQFNRFWSANDKQIYTANSALRSEVVANYNRRIRIPINEPVSKLGRSQTQEFVDYYGGAGVQHIAYNSDDIVASVQALRERGMQFMSVPAEYYRRLRNELKTAKITVTESIDDLERLGIVIDYDDNGYLLQIFSKPLQDRPTLFYEVIQRHNHLGFGAGNFKTLFGVIEAEQSTRNNLRRKSFTE